MHAATSKVENSAQGSSCKLKFVHASGFLSMAFPFVKSVKFDAISFKEISSYSIRIFMQNSKMGKCLAPASCNVLQALSILFS